MRKIGLLGGSFDPIHLGHVEMAKEARKQLGLDEVWFVLSADTPLKERKLSSYKDRKTMLHYALHPYRKLKGCFIEEGSTTKNYTVDTIRKLKKMYPKDKFYFMVGADQVEQLHKWKDIDILEKEVKFCAFERDGYNHKSSYEIISLKMKPVPISSSDVRNGNFKYLHPKVKRYMVHKVLYPNFLLNVMSEKRYLHSVSVANVCKELAYTYHLDEEIAYMCGMYHDINKEFRYIGIESSEVILQAWKPSLLEVEKGIWHGAIGRYICLHTLGIKEKKVLHAIEHHVLGQCKEKYAKILYLADKLEPLRAYDTSEMLALAHQDLNECFEMEKQRVLVYIEEKRKQDGN